MAGANVQPAGQLVADVSDAGLIEALEPGGDTVVVRLGDDSLAIQVEVQYPDGITHPQGVVAASVVLDNRPDGQSLFVTGNTDSLFIVDVASRQITARLAIGLDANGLAADSIGGRLYVSNQSDGTISVVDLSNNTVIRSVAVGGHPQELVLSPGGTLLFVADESGSVQIWDLREDSKRGQIDVPGGAFAMAVSPDWHQLYISSALGGAVYLVDWKTGGILKTVTTGGTPRRIGFNHQGTVAVIANEGGWVNYIQ
jgi:YVTN family beta-propeller protein